jgi:catechol 2,3-dioxygenase-like lactoylglutathione lyase family enzyme
MVMRTLPEASTIGQVALVVRDLDRAMATWAGLGIGPWRVYTFGPERLASMTFRGREQPQVIRIALCSVGPTTYELIEPQQGPTIYEEHLARCGEGLHHLGYYVDDIDAAVAAMAERGYAVLQAGRGFGVDGDGAYAYFDTARDVGCILEAIVGPRRMPEPERIVLVPGAARQLTTQAEDVV